MGGPGSFNMFETYRTNDYRIVREVATEEPSSDATWGE